MLYYFIFFSTDIDIEYEQNIDEDKKKKIIFDRYKYVIHHIIALTLLYTAYKNKNNDIIIKYTNIFIFLLELPTFFLCLNYILKQTGKIKILFISNLLFNILFILCRTILYNIFLYIFFKKYYKKLYKKIINFNLMTIHLIILSFINIIYGISNFKYLWNLFKNKKMII